MVTITQNTPLSQTFGAPSGPVAAELVPMPKAYSGGGSSGRAAINTDWDGGKFYGGYGDTKILFKNYWALRKRSREAFETNIYARGMIRRWVRNVINTGLTLECQPEASIIGLPQEEIENWSEDVEIRFGLWGKSKKSCDATEKSTFGKIQAMAEREALLEGDVLVVLKVDQRSGSPKVQLVSGGLVQTPLDQSQVRKGNEIKHGVEVDPLGRHVAFYVQQKDNTFKRIPAYGERSGRRIAWLYSPIDMTMCETRGTPLLGIVLQSLKEVDRYRDSVQRKAVVNSLLAMFIEKTQDKPGSGSFAAGATRKGQVTATAPETGEKRTVNNIAFDIPGITLTELQHGEVPRGFGNEGIDEKFADMEKAIIQAVAWALEIPPEIATLSFSSNYAASQAAINEYKNFLNSKRTDTGDDFCQPIFEEWLLAETLAGRIVAPGLLEAYRDPNLTSVYSAWVLSDWIGVIKPSADMGKTVKAYAQIVEQGWMTNARASREVTGMKYSRTQKGLASEKKRSIELGLIPDPELEKVIQKESSLAKGGVVGEVDDEKIKFDNLKSKFDAYGVAVRAGALTPQTDDEKSFRKEANLPAMSSEVNGAWADDGGVRRPITLQSKVERDAELKRESGIDSSENDDLDVDEIDDSGQ